MLFLNSLLAATDNIVGYGFLYRIVGTNFLKSIACLVALLPHDPNGLSMNIVNPGTDQIFLITIKLSQSIQLIMH